VESIKDRENTSLFLTPYSQSPMGDAEKVVVPNCTGPGSTPHEPVALVAKMSDSERSALESDGRGGLASASELNTTPPEIRCVYYMLYADGYKMPSKVAINSEEPSLGCIWADCIAPPHSPTSIKRCISRVERNPALAQRYADLFVDKSYDAPLKENHISFLRTDGPGLSPNEPMVIVRRPPPIPNGRYVIKNRAAATFWNAGSNPIKTVHFFPCSMEFAKKDSILQISICSILVGWCRSYRDWVYGSSSLANDPSG